MRGCAAPLSVRQTMQAPSILQPECCPARLGPGPHACLPKPQAAEDGHEAYDIEDLRSIEGHEWLLPRECAHSLLEAACFTKAPAAMVDLLLRCVYHCAVRERRMQWRAARMAARGRAGHVCHQHWRAVMPVHFDRDRAAELLRLPYATPGREGADTTGSPRYASPLATASGLALHDVVGLLLEHAQTSAGLFVMDWRDAVLMVAGSLHCSPQPGSANPVLMLLLEAGQQAGLLDSLHGETTLCLHNNVYSSLKELQGRHGRLSSEAVQQVRWQEQTTLAWPRTQLALLLGLGPALPPGDSREYGPMHAGWCMVAARHVC